MRTTTERSAFVSLADEWRESLGMNHVQFATWLGRRKDEWSHLLAGRRWPSESFVRCVRSRAAAHGGPWPSALDAAYQRDALARLAVSA